MENTVLKLLQCLSDINSNNCLVSVYMLVVRQEFKATNTPNTTLYRDRLCRNIQGGFSIQNIDFDILKILIVLKTSNNDI